MTLDILLAYNHNYTQRELGRRREWQTQKLTRQDNQEDKMVVVAVTDSQAASEAARTLTLAPREDPAKGRAAAKVAGRIARDQ